MRKLTVSTLMVLVLSLAFVGVMMAQTFPNPGSALTNVVLQNKGEATADVSVVYYDAAGASQHTDMVSIEAGAVVEVKTEDTPLPAGFRGAAVVSSNEPLASVVSVRNSGVAASAGGLTQGAYNGTANPATTISFPSVWRFSGIVSHVTIQNTEGTAATLDATFFDREGNQLGVCNESLGANGSLTYNMATPPACSGWTNDVADGSITVTSANQLAGASTAHWPNRAGAYQALTANDAGTVLYAPSHFRFKNNPDQAQFTLFSALNIQNTDPVHDAPITAEYFTRGDASGVPALTINITVPAGSAIGLNTSNGASVPAATFNPLGTDWDGSVRITSNDDILIVGTGITNWGVAGYAGIYALVTDNSASDMIFVPAQYRRIVGGNWAQWSAINLQNIGNTTVSRDDLTLTYIDTNGNAVATFTGSALPSDLAPGGAFGMNTRTGGDLAPGVFTPLGENFIGGILVQGPPGSQLVAVNNIVYSNRASSYNGVPR
jgi:hypothetical protein